MHTARPSTTGTARYLSDRGVAATGIYKVNEGRPHAVDHIKNGAIQLVINTPTGKTAHYDEAAIYRAAHAFEQAGDWQEM